MMCIFDTYPVIEGSTGDMSEVSEAIPLRARLSVHMIHIVVGNAFSQRLNLMLKNLTTKCRNIRHVERQATSQSAMTYQKDHEDTDLTGTISPVRISLAAAATRVGVRRLRRPIYI